MTRDLGSNGMAGRAEAHRAEAGMGRGWNPWRVTGWSAVAVILMLPLVAMQFTDEVDWSPFDFVAAGLLLGGTGACIELVVRRSTSMAYRAAAGLALLAAFALIWLNGAVGIIGDESDDSNLMLAGVLAIALLGALVARFRPLGMARAMLATAAAQALVGVTAVLAGWGSTGAGHPWDIAILTAGFVALWLGSAWLFLRAARG